MSHYYHVYPGEVEGVGRGATRPGITPSRSTKPGSRSGSPPRTSSPISAAFSTPPPPGASPLPKTTPEGVFTQVQEKPRVYVPEDDYSDGLFDDSFEFDDIPESQTNLTQIFPQCKVSDSSSSVPIPDKSSDQPDLLSRVLAHATSMEEDKKISEQDFCGENTLSSSPVKTTPCPIKPPVWGFLRQPCEAEFDRLYRPKQPESEPAPVPPPTESAASSKTAERRTENAPRTAQSGEKRSAMESPTRISEPMEDSGRSSLRPEESSSSDPSAKLSDDEIQHLLRGLKPDASFSRSMSEDSSGTALPNKIPAVPHAGPDYIQVPLDDESDSNIPTRITPTAKSTRNLDPDRFLPSSDAVEIATAVRYARHAIVRIVDGSVQETGLEKHNFPIFSRSMIQPPEVEAVSEVNNNTSVEITIPELYAPIRDQVNVTFDSDPVTKFLLVARNTLTSRWSVPSVSRFHDVLNQADGRIRREKIPCGGVLVWSSQWGGGVGLLGLNVTNPRALHIFRRVISEVRIGGMWYNTYPKNCLTFENEVSVFLRSELRCFDLEFLPNSLFENNRLLDGDIRVRYSKHHDKLNTDQDANPFLSNGGKIIIMEVDDKFLSSMQKYPTNYSFRLGSSTVKMKIDSDSPEQSMGSVNSVHLEHSEVSILPHDEPLQQHRNRRLSRTRWSGSQSSLDSFSLPLPVPSTSRDGKPYSRGRGKFRGKRGVSKKWN